MGTIRHKHHILPRHAGGTDDPSNIIEVSVQEHAELHFSLYLQHGRWQDWCAAYFLSGQTDIAEVISIRNKHNRAKAGPPSEETKAKTSATLKRKIAEGWKPGVSYAPKTEEHKLKNSESCKAKWDSGTRKPVENPGPTSDEGRKKCSETAKERWRKWRMERGLDPDTPVSKKHRPKSGD